MVFKVTWREFINAFVEPKYKASRDVLTRFKTPPDFFLDKGHKVPGIVLRTTAGVTHISQRWGSK